MMMAFSSSFVVVLVAFCLLSTVTIHAASTVTQPKHSDAADAENEATAPAAAPESTSTNTDTDDTPPPAFVAALVTPDEPSSVQPELPLYPPLAGPPAAQLPRRVVTYDQRQEGKYNIRADLENFMIVLIPSSPSSGSSLLDLLTRSAMQKSAAVGTPSKGGAGHNKKKKKYHGPTNVEKSDEITNKLNTATKAQFLQFQAAAMAAAAAQQQARRQQSVQQPQLQEPHAEQPFIEGRTPYHVDISSAELSDPAERHAGYERSSPPLFAVLRPVGMAAEPADLDHAFHRRRSVEIADRHSKSIVDALGAGAANDLNQNTVAALAVGPLNEQYFESNRGFASDYADLGATGPISSNSNNFENADAALGIASSDSIDQLAAGETPKSGPVNDGWDQLTLLGATEQCGPDRRRDSYGVCQFVPIE